MKKWLKTEVDLFSYQSKTEGTVTFFLPAWAIVGLGAAIGFSVVVFLT